jgi:hypothetical protein
MANITEGVESWELTIISDVAINQMLQSLSIDTDVLYDANTNTPSKVSIFFIIHMCIQCLGHFSLTTYPTPSLSLPPPRNQAETILP